MGENLKQPGQRCLFPKSADLKPTLKSGMRKGGKAPTDRPVFYVYYLDYQNDRGKFVEAFWTIVNWTAVNKRLDELLMS